MPHRASRPAPGEPGAELPDGPPGGEAERYRECLDFTLQAAQVYRALAESDRSKERSEVLDRLAGEKTERAAVWAGRLGIDAAKLRPPRRRLKLAILRLGARLVGSHRLVPLILRFEARERHRHAGDSEAREVALEERSHSLELLKLAGAGDELEAIRAERQHLTNQSGSLRAAVLGINDGLVSNLSLVMGVAGGVANPDIVLLAGVAGLLAGAFSMGAGEYISMRSQRDVYENELRVERAKIERMPDEEREELVLIYRAKGLTQDEAEVIARRVMEDPDIALDTMSREELGLDPSELGSPWSAAASSLVAFVAGAAVPILPYLFDAGDLAFLLSALLSGVALAGVGASLGWVSGKSIAWAGARMLLAGGAAAAITFGVGSAIGVAIQT